MSFELRISQNGPLFTFTLDIDIQFRLVLRTSLVCPPPPSPFYHRTERYCDEYSGVWHSIHHPCLNIFHRIFLIRTAKVVVQ